MKLKKLTMLNHLAQGDQQLSQVSADMAQDLRTPIGSLIGQIAVALSQPRSIMRLHQGCCVVRSENGVNRFSLLFPR